MPRLAALDATAAIGDDGDVGNFAQRFDVSVAGWADGVLSPASKAAMDQFSANGLVVLTVFAQEIGLAESEDFIPLVIIPVAR